MVEERIVSRTASASLALSGSQLLAKLIDFCLILVLARLLTPEDFALIAIAMIFVQLTEAILEMPVAQALVRTNRVTRDMLYTAFTISLLRSLIVVLIILILTPIAAFAFDDPRLYVLMPILSFAPAVRGLYNPKMVLFARRLNFYPEAIISIIARAITAIVALPFALITESYWALVLMTLLSPALLLLASYLYLPFLPRLSFKSWSVFANMVGWSTVSQFFSAANWQVKVFVLALFASRTTTGNYSIGANLNGIVQQSILMPLLRPFVSTFSLLEKNGTIQMGYLISSRALLMSAGPVFLVLAILAQPIVVFLFGDEWSEAPVFLSVLAGCTLITVAVRPAGSVAYAQDRTFYLALHNAVSFTSLAALLWAGYYWYGLTGFLAAQFVGAAIFVLSSLWMIKKLIKLNYIQQIKVLFVPTIALTTMALCMIWAAPFVRYDGKVVLLGSIASVAMFGLTIYLLVVFLAWNLLGRPDGVEKTVWNALFMGRCADKAT